jgi:hypothetical protein
VSWFRRWARQKRRELIHEGPVVIGRSWQEHFEPRLQRESVTCPLCSMTSYHPMDVEMGYCGRCHQFTSPRLR